MIELARESSNSADAVAQEPCSRPCPRRQNCVSSRESERHHIAPFNARLLGAGAIERLRRILEAMPGTRIVTAEARYLHAECVSRVFRFVDDIEFCVDADANVVHVRAASRIGYSDFGVNRRRVEAIRAAFERTGR